MFFILRRTSFFLGGVRLSALLVALVCNTFDRVIFTSREEVRERLPDILGKALALIWIDREFADMFARDPQGTLEAEGVVLPENMAIEFQKPGTDRPRIVVYERRPNSNFKLRILYLQLVMMAGR